jgi:DNA-binding Lrp family transcriptional regulator
MQWQGCPHIHVHDVDPYEFVVSANIHRRHLTTEQRLELVDKFVKANPEKSDRQIAETVKASPTTVGKRRARLEKSGDVSTVDTRQDKRGRQQPAKKCRTLEDFQKDVQEKRAAEAAKKVVPDIKAQAVAVVHAKEVVPAQLVNDIVAKIIEDDFAFARELRDVLRRATTWFGPKRSYCPCCLLKALDAGIDGTNEVAGEDDGLDIPDSLRRTPALN